VFGIGAFDFEASGVWVSCDHTLGPVGIGASERCGMRKGRAKALNTGGECGRWEDRWQRAEEKKARSMGQVAGVRI